MAGPVQVYSSNGSAHQFVTSVNAIIVNQFAKYSVTVSPKAHTASTTVSTIEFYGTYGTGRIPTIRKLQIKRAQRLPLGVQALVIQRLQLTPMLLQFKRPKQKLTISMVE
ncbi:hypothetical protein J820_4110 [Acinetobacter baumannii 25766_7]|nr:hypothetical protein J820_4110 [Acinetobacter baumannii 25766_7]